MVPEFENQLYIYRTLRYAFTDLTEVEQQVTPLILDVDVETYQTLQRQPPVDQFRLDMLATEQLDFEVSCSEAYYLRINSAYPKHQYVREHLIDRHVFNL
jgi:hypothetical protein